MIPNFKTIIMAPNISCVNISMKVCNYSIQAWTGVFSIYLSVYQNNKTITI